MIDTEQEVLGQDLGSQTCGTHQKSSLEPLAPTGVPGRHDGGKPSRASSFIYATFMDCASNTSETVGAHGAGTRKGLWHSLRTPYENPSLGMTPVASV